MKRPIFFSLFLVYAAVADGPADNVADNVRPIPPPGIIVSAKDKAELMEATRELGAKIETLRLDLTAKTNLLVELLPDVEIYHKAVLWALELDEFYKTNELKVARELLQEGEGRVAALRAGQAPWLTATGLVVRGYRSRIDDSVQPYGLVIPPTWNAASAQKFRLDFWFHGRGEKLTELDFIQGRRKTVGEFAPPNTFVLHPYGRYCNGNRFAGETDVFEAFEHASKFYQFDRNRISVRGFSLGGAACWHFATHHAWRWAAAAPGAGFSETADFLKVFQGEKLQPADYEQKLWRLYDATEHAINLVHCPTVAYSGEIDKQKQAADMMSQAMSSAGLDLLHIIGPKTGHSYHPDAKKEINRKIDAIMEKGRDPLPRQIHFTTWTLKYNRMHWVIVEGLKKHWEQAHVEARLDTARNVIELTTTNVTQLRLRMEPGEWPFDALDSVQLKVNAAAIRAPSPKSDRSWDCTLEQGERGWSLQTKEAEPRGGLRKRHGLQGPIDDAFMSSFLVVRPTGESGNAKLSQWVSKELARATNQWRLQFRGLARVKDDTEITPEDIQKHHLVLWGDAKSNKLIERIASSIPLKTQAPDQALILIYPNPLNPEKYVVLNSGFTFREYDYLNNARQTPKLPDYAIIDLNTAPNSRFPGKIVRAGFFDEAWQMPAN